MRRGHQDGACSWAWHRHVGKVRAWPFQQHGLRREEREVVSCSVATQPPTARLVRWTARLGGWRARRREAVVPPVPWVAAVQVAVGAARRHASAWLLLREPADGRAARGRDVQEKGHGRLREHAGNASPCPVPVAVPPPAESSPRRAATRSVGRALGTSRRCTASKSKKVALTRMNDAGKN